MPLRSARFCRKPVRDRHRLQIALLFTAIAALGCEGAQSALAARGPAADDTARLAWLMFAGAALIFVGIMALIALAARGPRGLRRALGGERSIVLGGVALPIATLSGLLVHGLGIEGREPDRAAALAIEVSGLQWWWRVGYLDDAGRREFETANEIRIPVGQPVELRLRSEDVIHSFWVPSLAGKLDMIPGRLNRLRIQADHAGVYRGQCAEFCGGAHALMALHVVALPEADFADWRARQREPAAMPQGDEARRGHDVFFQSGCALCHRLAGTAALGRLGPDLSHVGSRLHIMSGLLPNHRGTLAGWIASAQTLKPENLMPSFDRMQGADLRALAAYLAELE